MAGLDRSRISNSIPKFTPFYLVSKANTKHQSRFELVFRLLSRPWFNWQAWVVKIFGGHYSVLKSVLLGLKRTGVSISLNPNLEKLPNSSDVLILSGEEQLRQLLGIEGIRITVGPNFHNDVSCVLEMLEDAKVRNVLVPSPWVSELYRSMYPSLSEKIRIWAASAEVPRIAKMFRSRISPKKILVYAKGDKTVVEGVCGMLSMRGVNYSLLTYGNHSRLRYLFELATSSSVVYVGRTESQGLAIQEAWAMSVKTFVYKDAEFLLSEYGQHLAFMGSPQENAFAPYLRPEDGAMWSNLEELESFLGGNQPPHADEPRSLGEQPSAPKSHLFSVAHLLRIMST